MVPMFDQSEPLTKFIISPVDRIVILMGPTGVGKSTFINYATRQNSESIGHSLKSQSSDIRAVRTRHPYDNGSIILVDTPGFDDTHRSDIETLSQIAGWFIKFSKEKVPLSAIVYLHRISDTRTTGSPLKGLQMFARMCGQAAMPRVCLATTMWSETLPETGARREKELKRSFWDDMIKMGCTVQRFDDSYESAWKVIGKLPTERENVILSRKIYDDKKRLNETAAGVKLTEELQRLIKNQKDATNRLAEQVEKQDNPVLVEELTKRRARIEGEISNIAQELQAFKIPVGIRIKNFFTGKKARKSGLKIQSSSGEREDTRRAAQVEAEATAKRVADSQAARAAENHEERTRAERTSQVAAETTTKRKVDAQAEEGAEEKRERTRVELLQRQAERELHEETEREEMAVRKLEAVTAAQAKIKAEKQRDREHADRLAHAEAEESRKRVANIVAQATKEAEKIEGERAEAERQAESAHRSGNSGELSRHPKNGARYVIIMGSAGSGKITFITKASGTSESNVHHTSTQRVPDIIRTICDQHPLARENGRVIFFETPGLVDDDSQDFDILYSTIDWLKQQVDPENGDELAGIIFLHRITDTRMASSYVKNLSTFARLCGCKDMQNVAFVTTMWEGGIPEDKAQVRQRELEEIYLDDLVKQNGEVTSFRGNEASAWRVINHLLDQKPRPRMHIQKEMGQG